MNIEQFDLCTNVNNLIDISNLPLIVKFSNDFDLAFVPSTWNPEFNYIPDAVASLMINAFDGSIAELADVTLDKNGYFSCYESIKCIFDRSSVGNFIDKTGLQFLIIEFKKDGTIFIGLDMDFLLILSRKRTGFIAQCGGIKQFHNICRKIFINGESGMDEKVFRDLDNAIYGETAKMGDAH